MNNEKYIRRGFKVEHRVEPDAKENYQNEIRIWIGSVGNQLPHLSNDELRILHKELSEIVKNLK